MKLFKATSAILFMLVFLPGISAQSIKVSGSGEGYAGKKIEAYLLSDPISGRMNPVSVMKCDSTGSFSLEFTVKNNGTLFLKSGVYLFRMIVDGGKAYSISLPPFVPLNASDANNPFFSPSVVIPYVLNDSADVNNLIRHFDDKYHTVLTRVSERVINKTRLDELPSLVGSLNSAGMISEDEFFRDYVTYRMIMLNAVAFGEYPGRKEDSVMINRNFLSGNPAYTDLIEHLFRDYFRVLLSGPEARQLMNSVARRSLHGVEDLFSRDGKAVNRELQHYVILMNMYLGFYNGLFDTGTLTGMLDSLAEKGESGYIKDLAVVLKNNVFRMKKGSVPPQFSLPDTEGKRSELSDFRGRHLLLVFVSGPDQAALSELSLLKSWSEKHRDKLTVAVIVTGESFRETVAFFLKRGYNWKFLDASGSAFLASEYDIRLFPGFVLADPDGRLAVDYCPPPSENLEGFLSRLGVLK